jgi:hypothetical protein
MMLSDSAAIGSSFGCLSGYLPQSNRRLTAGISDAIKRSPACEMRSVTRTNHAR